MAKEKKYELLPAFEDREKEKRFGAARDRVITFEARERHGIGMQKEKTLHAVLKCTEEPDADCQEIPVGSYIADIMTTDKRIIEIQTANMNAMRDKMTVEVTYQSFWKDEPSTFILHPYCLKLFKQRWYVLGRGDGYDDPWIYALDERMKNVIPQKKALKMPAKFNAAEFFGKYFGVILDDRKPTPVKVKVVSDQVRYIVSLPLHDTQKLIEETPEYGIFEYYLVPTYDFRQELLSHGPDVEVLEPKELRDEIKADIALMYKNYGL